MAEVVLYHHVQGLTPGLLSFAAELRAPGHTVHTPDLFEGRTFESIDAGLAYVRGVGFGNVLDRGVRAGASYPAEVVWAGFSLGVAVAQNRVQTRWGAKGALFFHSCLPVSEFGEWPGGVPVQIHSMDADPFFVDEGDIEAARELVATTPDAELFLYPGNKHLFADPSVADYEPAAAALLLQRVLEFLARV